MARPIQTNFYDHRHNVVRTNTANDANRAIALALLHLQVAHYRDDRKRPAASCEVFDSEHGQLHAVLKRSPATGTVTITYKRDPEKFETRLALGALLNDEKKAKK